MAEQKPAILSSPQVLITIVLAIGAALWALADPRGSIKETNANFANYLSIREHNEYKEGLRATINEAAKIPRLEAQIEDLQRDLAEVRRAQR